MIKIIIKNDDNDKDTNKNKNNNNNHNNNNNNNRSVIATTTLSVRALAQEPQGGLVRQLERRAGERVRVRVHVEAQDHTPCGDYHHHY